MASEATELTTAEGRLYRLRLIRCFIEEGGESACARFQLSHQELLALQQQDWWADCSKEYFAAEAAVLDRKLTQLIDKAVTQMGERLENGDKVLDRFGDQHDIPMSGADVARVASTLMEKRQVLRGLPGAIVKAEINLNSLAEKLRSLARKEAPLTVEAINDTST